MNPPFLVKRVHRYFVSQSLSQRIRVNVDIILTERGAFVPNMTYYDIWEG